MYTLSTIEAGETIVLNIDREPTKENTRRLSRTATLDGGAVITDGGWTDADRTLEFTAMRIPEETRENLWAMFRKESRVQLCCPEGVFTGYLQQIRFKGNSAAITFMVHEKLT